MKGVGNKVPDPFQPGDYFRRRTAMATASEPPLQNPAPQPGRRHFLRWLTYGLGALASVAVAIPFVGYLFGPRKAPVDPATGDVPPYFPLGPVEDFPENQTRRVTFPNPIRQPWDGMVADTAVYVRFDGRDHKGDDDDTKGYKFLVLAVNCAHLGCPVEWFQESGLFMCPCHGGVYYANGARASGPPPRGLYRCVYRIRSVRGLDVLDIQAPHFPTLQDTLEG
jgi:menaquinol-cytochrome c reductase iron-sulfur subunit